LASRLYITSQTTIAMKNILSGSLLLFAILFIISSCTNNKSTMKPPVAKKNNKELTAHDHTRIDPYYWLNDRENQEVINYLEEENAYTSTLVAWMPMRTLCST